MYPSLADYASADPLDLDRLRHDLVIAETYAPSFGLHADLDEQIAMLEKEFSGQHRIKLVHAVLNVLLRRGIAPEAAKKHFRKLWAEHADILLATLDSRWLVSACDTICDYPLDATEAQTASLVSLFVNTVKLAETERLISSPTASDPARIDGWTPLFDGMSAFMPGLGDMPANLLARIDRALQPDTLPAMIGRELIGRVLSSDTVYRRLAKMQTERRWQPYLPPAPVAAVRDVGGAGCKPTVATKNQPGYILLNDTGRLGDGFHLGTLYACGAIRQNLRQRGLHEIGWANDRQGFDTLLAGSARKPDLVVLNGEGTLHHGAARGVELLSLCNEARKQGVPVAVINSVWEANPDAMVAVLRKMDLVHVRDGMSRAELPKRFRARVTPDVSIQMFRQALHSGSFPPAKHAIGVMDSVVPDASAALLGFAEAQGLPFFAMPGGALQQNRTEVAARSGPVWPRLLQVTDLMSADAWITGRFHGMIAALCAARPVCAVQSNTAKIEGLLQDAGLADACLLDADWVSVPDADKHNELKRRFAMQLQPDFVRRRDDFLETAVERIDRMFDTVARLAASRPYLLRVLSVWRRKLR